MPGYFGGRTDALAGPMALLLLSGILDTSNSFLDENSPNALRVSSQL